MEVILKIAEVAGLNKMELADVLQEGRYLQRLLDVQGIAYRSKINSAPTFIINDGFRIVGAQPISYFRSALDEIAKSK